MSQFFPTVRPVPQRQLGFLMADYADGGGGYDDASGDYWGGWGIDPWGNYYENDWYNTGGGYDSLPFVSTNYDYSNYWPSGGIDAGSPTELQADYLYNWAFNPDAIDYGYGSGFYGSDPNSGGGGGGGFDWQSFFDQLVPWVVPSFDGAPNYADYGSDPGSSLPGYCPKGTYHPVNDPMSCVPFPPNDPNAKKQASAQQKAQQAAANAAKKAQQQQDKACPKDPQGRPVWKNPATGKCELVPPCPQGMKFDSATRRCLTPAQAQQLYGNDYTWVWWILGAVGAALVLRGFADSGSSSSPRSRRK